MNEIYAILNKAVEIFSEPATLTKRDGTVLEVRLAPEDESASTFQSSYAGAIGATSFSVALDDLTVEGATRYPEEGDVIEGSFGSETPLRWKVVKDATSGRAWRWRWDRPGTRVLFQAMKIADAGRKA